MYKTILNSRLANLSKIYHSINSIGKRIFLSFLLILLFNNFTVSQTTDNTIKTIVIDPGHGGRDPGNLGTGRYKKTEKNSLCYHFFNKLKLIDNNQHFFEFPSNQKKLNLLNITVKKPHYKEKIDVSKNFMAK